MAVLGLAVEASQSYNLADYNLADNMRDSEYHPPYFCLG